MYSNFYIQMKPKKKKIVQEKHMPLNNCFSIKMSDICHKKKYVRIFYDNFCYYED